HNTISVLDAGQNFRYRSPASGNDTDIETGNQRASMSYVTGSHNFKVGLLAGQGDQQDTLKINDANLSYTFRNGVPIQLTETASPFHTHRAFRELGVYAQDQWTIKRLTLNLGVRFDDLHSRVVANDLPAGRFIDARSFPGVDCVPCLKDVNP